MPAHRQSLLAIEAELNRIAIAAQRLLDDPSCKAVKGRIDEIREAAASAAGVVGALIEEGDSGEDGSHT